MDDFKRAHHEGKRWYTHKRDYDNDWHPGVGGEARARLKREIPGLVADAENDRTDALYYLDDHRAQIRAARRNGKALFRGCVR